LRLARIVGAGAAAQRQQCPADSLGQEDLAHHPALAEHGKLQLPLVAGNDVRPGQSGELTDADASGVEDLEEDAIALGARSPDKQRNVDLADDALGQRRVAVARVGSAFGPRRLVERRDPDPPKRVGLVPL
jgi:hypothetical protein